MFGLSILFESGNKTINYQNYITVLLAVFFFLASLCAPSNGSTETKGFRRDVM